jgi:uncharacterized protein YaaQ
VAKLLIAIVHRADADLVADRLRADGHRFTRIPTVGGFLGEENATFMLAAEDELVAPIVEVFEDAAHGRELDVPLVLLERLADWQARTVSHGGATILVADLERIIRI